MRCKCGGSWRWSLEAGEEFFVSQRGESAHLVDGVEVLQDFDGGQLGGDGDFLDRAGDGEDGLGELLMVLVLGEADAQGDEEDGEGSGGGEVPARSCEPGVEPDLPG